MGLGKTVITLSIIADDIDSCLSTGCLIIAPIKVVEQVWSQEAQKWDHLRKIKVATISGVARDREAVLKRGGADVYLISYSNLLWLSEWMLENQPPFDSFAFDESSMMKSSGAKRFKRFKPFTPFFRRRMILTGTPAAESLINLWAQYFLLDQGKRLGKYITHFKAEHYRQQDRYGYKLLLKPGHDKLIYAAVKDITLTLRAEDHLKMDPVIYNTIKLELSPRQMKDYKKFEDEMFVEMEEGSVEALNAASLSMRCRQFTSGALYDAEKPGSWYKLHDVKMDALEDMLDQMDGQPLLVAYEFRHEAERFRKRWPKAPIIGGGTKSKETNDAFKKWNAGKLPVMFVQPQSVGHGVNLQFGGHTLLWYTTTWSGERYMQTVKRLHRSGQTHPVTVHHFVCTGTVDPLVLTAQRRKGKNQGDMMTALSGYKRKSLHP
jgi:SNF2 family DNA or RNA helicase